MRRNRRRPDFEDDPNSENPLPTLGPNTNAPADLLAPHCILCCGEDRATLLAAAERAGLGGFTAHFAYRCYEFWKRDDLLLILTGIGGGCLEPLLWEIFSLATIDKIILVGTAGKMPESSATGGVYLVEEAWSAGTGLDGERLDWPLRPRWDDRCGLPEASSVSTDFYFGFSPRIESGDYPFSSGLLRSSYLLHKDRRTDLVEMEVASFYAFCATFPGRPSQYIAAKAVSNAVGQDDEQVPNSQRALVDAITAAKTLLRLG
jgi:purine-nucleoside phosphorylase